MVEHPGHLIFKKLIRSSFNNNLVAYEKIGRIIVNALLDIASKKLP
jgi:hypothetical protein